MPAHRFVVYESIKGFSSYLGGITLTLKVDLGGKEFRENEQEFHSVSDQFNGRCALSIFCCEGKENQIVF